MVISFYCWISNAYIEIHFTEESPQSNFICSAVCVFVSWLDTAFLIHNNTAHRAEAACARTILFSH